MTNKYLLFLLFIGFSTIAHGQKSMGKSTAKIAVNKSTKTPADSGLKRLPDSLQQQLSACNGVDVVLFLKGKSMEFADKNAKAPVSFIGPENATTVQGYKHIGLYTYKINGSVFLDCDILLNESQTEALMRFKTASQQVFYRKMNASGLNILLQWIK